MSDANRRSKESFYSKLFARFYDPFMEAMEQRVLSRFRKRLLDPLSGHVLEVGSGTGVNFKLYPEGCHIIASEPSEHMLQYASERLRTEPVKAEVELVLAGVGDRLLEEHIPSEGLDAIVCTLVLCTIPDPEAAMAGFAKWLKPGGRLIVLEHVHGSSRARRVTHDLLNPIWKRFAEGCHLNRDTAEMLLGHGFTPIWEERFTKVVPFYIAEMTRDH